MQKIRETLESVVVFFRESWQEVKKVHWPTRKETYAATAVVLVVVMIIAFFLALVDLGLTKGLQLILD